MKSRGHWIVATVIVLSVALRLAAALPLTRSPLLVHPVLDDADYQARTAEIRNGSWRDTEIPRGSVLYPYLGALVPGIERGGTGPLAVAQSLLEGFTVLLLVLWIRKRWGLTAAAGAGLLYALDPLGAFFAARFSPVVPSTLAFVGCLWLLDQEERAPQVSLRSGATLGGVATAGFLLQPLPFLALLGIRAHGVVSAGRGRNPSRWFLALFPIGLVLAVSSLVLFHHAGLEQGGPILSWGGGPALQSAFDPGTGGTPRNLKPPSWIPEISLKTLAWEGLGREGTQYDLFRYFAIQGLQGAVENPVRTLGVVLTKAAGTVGAFPIPDALSPTFLAARQAPLFGYLGVSLAVLLGLGLAGLVLLRGDPTRRVLSRGLLAVLLAALLGMTSAGARQAALPLLAALGGGWIAGAAGRTASRFKLHSLGALAGGAALSLVAGTLSPTAALRNPSEDLRLLASTFSQSRNWRQAVPLLEEAVRADHANLEARVALAQAYQKDALLNAAQEQLEAALEADSTHDGTLFSMAVLRQSQNRLDDAIELMSRLVRERPNNPLFLNDLGQMLAVRGRIPDALALFSRAVRLKPDYTVARQNLEMMETYKQRMEAALFPESMRLPESDPLQRALPLIVAAMDQKNWTQADSLIRLGETQRPDQMLPHWMRAAYYARRGEKAQAIAALERCNRMAPGRPAVVQQMAELYLASHQGEKVLPVIAQSLKAAEGDSVRVVALTAIRQKVEEALRGER